MARRWILVAVVAAVLVVGGVFAARAIRDDGTDTAKRAPSTTLAPSSTSLSTTTAPVSTAAPTTTSAPTSTTGPPEPCGPSTASMRAAIDAAVSGAAQSADISTCRLAASDPSWAAVGLVAKPGAQFAALTVIVHETTGAWSVVAQGGPDAGCGVAPQQVIVDLGQFCVGTGGGAAQ